MATDDGNGSVRVGLADIWRAQQDTTKAIVEVNLTLTKIWGHLEAIDERNKNADRLHEEHDRRLRVVESVIDALQPTKMKDDFEGRIRKLEDAQVSERSVTSAKGKARAALWAAVGAIAAAISALVLVFTNSHGHF